MFMTPSEQALIADAISLLSGYPVSRPKDEVLSYINLYKQEKFFTKTPDSVILADMIRQQGKIHKPSEGTASFVESQIQVQKNTEGLNKAYAAVREILTKEGFGKPIHLFELMQEIYSHPDCLAYYKTQAGLWLMTNVITHCIGQYLANNKEGILNAAIAANLNGIKDAIFKKEF